MRRVFAALLLAPTFAKEQARAGIKGDVNVLVRTAMERLARDA